MMEHSMHSMHDTHQHDHPVHNATSCTPSSHMVMYFHFGYCETILFESWQVTNVSSLIASMIGLFILSVLYEGLKYFREYLFWQAFHTLQYRTVTIPEKSATGNDDQTVRTVGEVVHKQPHDSRQCLEYQTLILRPSMFSIVHGLQTLLHIVQIVLSYFLMLVFMTFNVWLCMAVSFGAAFGYFLFGWKKSVIVDVTEHCH